MWPFSVSINLREALGLFLIFVGLVLVPVGWMWSRQLWLVAGLIWLLGVLLFFSERIMKRVEEDAKEGGEAGGSHRMPLPGDVHNYSGWRHGGRSENMDGESSSGGGD